MLRHCRRSLCHEPDRAKPRGHARPEFSHEGERMTESVTALPSAGALCHCGEAEDERCDDGHDQVDPSFRKVGGLERISERADRDQPGDDHDCLHAERLAGVCYRIHPDTRQYETIATSASEAPLKNDSRCAVFMGGHAARRLQVRLS